MLSTLRQQTSFVGTRLSYPFIQTIRERRQPLRGRYELARAGLQLGSLHQVPRTRDPFRALRGLIGAVDPNGPIFGITMVRNEQVRIGGAIRTLVEGGVDVVVVADNLSTDETRDRLRELARDLPIVVVDDTEPAYYQGPKMSLIARAATRRGASWIVPFDADELWLGVDAPLSVRLRESQADAIRAPMFDFLPTVDTQGLTDPYTELTRRTPHPVTEKIAFRAHLLASIQSGNHSVAQPARTITGPLVIRHYPFLGFEHFAAKARNGGAALALTDFPADIGGHWREWAESDDQRMLEEWRSIVATPTVEDPLPLQPFDTQAGFGTEAPASSQRERE